ncbi:hypothetical protein LLB_3077 [Legionella longbeachae D-4968]|nr:hypothetical protein LLB_3077 [Legionella longbeachae D-4968]
MEKFVPWNAKKNPFIPKRFSLFQCFGSTNEVAEEINEDSRFK